MMKVYEVNFRQSFEETRTVFAHSEDDAIEKIKESGWDCGDLHFFGVEEISDTTKGHSEDYDGGATFKR